jgi:hypothetical protein
MGEGFSLECKNCAHHDRFMLGVGMAYYSLENVMQCLPTARRKRVRQILDTREILRTDYYYELYACPKCCTLHERFFVSIADNDGVIYETSFRCGKCRELLAAVEFVGEKMDWSPYVCKSCGEHALVEGISLCWD